MILVRRDAETDDIAALEIAEGLLTGRGARTSHAAVVARQLGKVCLVGCEELHIDMEARSIRLGGQALDEGALITLDGNTGCIYAGHMQTTEQRQVELETRLATFRATRPVRKARAAQS